jgi:hypothetical protein
MLGLAAIVMSVVLDGTFATDGITPVPEPNILALMGIGGAVAILASIFRGPRK